MKKIIPYLGVIFAIILLAIIFMPKKNGINLGANYASSLSTVYATTTTTVAGNASIVLRPTSARKYAIITNTGGTIAYLAFNSATTTALLNGGISAPNFAIPLAASGGSYVINDLNLYKGQVIASSSAAVEIRALSIY